MSNEIAALQQQIDQAGAAITPAVVDAMNKLAALQVTVNVNQAKEIALAAVERAKIIKYQPGEAMALLNAGLCASVQRNYDEASGSYNRALDIYNSLNDLAGIAESNKKLGNIGLRIGRYDEAIKHYNHALGIRQQLGDELAVADLYANSAAVYGLQGNYLQALRTQTNALDTYERLGASSRIASTVANMALIYRDLKNYDEALKMFERASHLREELGDHSGVCDIWNSMGVMYEEQGKLPEAMHMFQRALDYLEKSGDTFRKGYLYSNMGNVYKAMGQLDQALAFYSKSLALFEGTQEKRALIQTILNLGALHFEKADYKQAQLYLSQTISLCEEVGQKNDLRKALEILSKLFAVKGDYENAYNTYLRYSGLDKELSNTETNRQIAQITLQGEIKQKERDAEQERIKNAELTKAYNSLEDEKRRSDNLLNNILPEEVSEELKQHGKTKARSYSQVTVMFADIKNFTGISEQLSAEELVSGIDEYFEEFDKIVEKCGIEKIKTIGDAYLCAGGIPLVAEDHAQRVVLAAKEFLTAAWILKQKRIVLGKPVFDFRIGIHTGPVVAGVVGIKKFAYDIWGDTVNTASRMQQYGEPNRINISQSTYELVKDTFNCIFRGEIEAKHKGKLKMYFVE